MSFEDSLFFKIIQQVKNISERTYNYIFILISYSFETIVNILKNLLIFFTNYC